HVSSISSPPVCLCLPRRHPSSTLFPYTTLFRSARFAEADGAHDTAIASLVLYRASTPSPITHTLYRPALCIMAQGQKVVRLENRSEEHTSELQSRENIVCRLLLEKKKKITIIKI